MSGRGSEGRERALRAGSLHLAGRTIGLCNGKLKAMSGEEVESTGQDELAGCVGKVGSSQGARRGGAGVGGSFSPKFTDSSPPLRPGFCLLQDQPKAQAQNHKGKLCASCVRWGQSRAVALPPGGGPGSKVAGASAVLKPCFL